MNWGGGLNLLTTPAIPTLLFSYIYSWMIRATNTSCVYCEIKQCEALSFIHSYSFIFSCQNATKQLPMFTTVHCVSKCIPASVTSLFWNGTKLQSSNKVCPQFNKILFRIVHNAEAVNKSRLQEQ